ncbi:MAG: hypothetical protein M3536_12040, partial [Actinomycetota bacterium]|nr:hypothetical protein [Actinomycetota bacterium]
MAGWVALPKSTAGSGAGSTSVNGVVCIVISLLEDVFHMFRIGLCAENYRQERHCFFHNAEDRYRVVK